MKTKLTSAALGVAAASVAWLAMVGEFAQFGTAEKLYTDSGWVATRDDGSTMTHHDMSTQREHEYILLATMDGVESTALVDTLAVFGMPAVAKLHFSEVGADTSGGFTMLFGEQQWGPYITAPMPHAKRPTYRIEYTTDPAFSVFEVSELAATETMAVTVSDTVTWYLRAHRRDLLTGTWRWPSPPVAFRTAAAPPTVGNLLRAWWPNAWQINMSFADTVDVLTVGDIVLELNGQPLASSAAPARNAWNEWRQYRGDGARQPGTWLAVVLGDSFRWAEQ